MRRKPERPYWQPNPHAKGYFTPEKTPKHEALHTAVAIILGYRPVKIRINKDGSGVADTEPFPRVGWHRAAMALAPVLIDDFGTSDQEYMSGVRPRSRGYAWRWLKENRNKILRKANKIVTEMGKPGGTLLWNDDGSVEWRPRKKVKR